MCVAHKVSMYKNPDIVDICRHYLEPSTPGSPYVCIVNREMYGTYGG